MTKDSPENIFYCVSDMTEKVPENFSEIVFLKMFFQTWTNNFLKLSALI